MAVPLSPASLEGPIGRQVLSTAVLERGRPVIREELARLLTYEERHRRLLARLLLALGSSVVVFVVGTLVVWAAESGQKGGDINGLGDAAFFTAVQLLTVSSSIKNPLTSLGKAIDIALEVWAVFVITAVAGSFATFFNSSDAS
jgi:hypothetical protein